MQTWSKAEYFNDCIGNDTADLYAETRYLQPLTELHIILMTLKRHVKSYVTLI